MGTYVLQAKTNSYMATDWEKLKGQNGVGEIFSFQLRCLHPAKIFVGAYRKIDKFILLKDLRVTQKQEKTDNRVDQQRIVFCYGNFEGMELYPFKRQVGFITEGPYSTKLLINNPSIKNTNKTKVLLEEDTHLMPVATLCKNINELRAQGYKVDGKNEPVPDNIPNQTTQQDI